MITIEYTQEEIQELTALIDVAIKTGGLQIAGVAMKHFAKLNEAFQANQKDE